MLESKLKTKRYKTLNKHLESTIIITLEYIIDKEQSCAIMCQEHNMFCGLQKSYVRPKLV